MTVSVPEVMMDSTVDLRRMNAFQIHASMDQHVLIDLMIMSVSVPKDTVVITFLSPFFNKQ